jgi:hypothetical protein
MTANAISKRAGIDMNRHSRKINNSILYEGKNRFIDSIFDLNSRGR